MTDTKEEEVNADKVKRWISGMHALVLVLLLSIVGAEAALWDSVGNGIALPFPKLYAFLGGKRATSVLLNTVARRDKTFATEAAVILIGMGKTDEIVRMGDNAVPTLAALLYYRDDLDPGDLFYYSYPLSLDDGNIRGKAARMLARIGRPARSALYNALIDESSDIRALAAAALIETGDRALIPFLRDADIRIHQTKLLSEAECATCDAILRLEPKI